MPPTLITDDLSFGGNTSGLLDCSTDALAELKLSSGPATDTGPPSPTKAHLSRSAKSRPSWGPPTTAGNTQGIRLLDGLPAPPQWSMIEVQEQSAPDASASQSNSGAGSSAGGSKVRLGGIERGKGKPRFSLFAKPAYAPSKRTAPTAVPAPAAAPALPALSDGVPLSSSGDDLGSLSGTASAAEGAQPLPTREEYVDEISQLKALNNVFSNYDAMLEGTAEHIDIVAARVRDINKLMDIYIDFLRRSQQIHSLLVDPMWQGISEEGRLHDEAVAAAAQAAAKRQAEAEAKRREEAARREAQQEAARQRAEAAASSARLGSRRPGRPGASARVPSASGTRTASHTRTSSNPSLVRSASGRSGTSGPRGGTSGTGTGISGIPRPSVAGGKYGHVQSSGYGRR